MARLPMEPTVLLASAGAPSPPGYGHQQGACCRVGKSGLALAPCCFRPAAGALLRPKPWGLKAPRDANKTFGALGNLALPLDRRAELLTYACVLTKKMSRHERLMQCRMACLSLPHTGCSLSYYAPLPAALAS